MVQGNIINVPVDVASTVNILPRIQRNTETIAIKLKKKRSTGAVNLKGIKEFKIDGSMESSELSDEGMSILSRSKQYKFIQLGRRPLLTLLMKTDNLFMKGQMHYKNIQTG